MPDTDIEIHTAGPLPDELKFTRWNRDQIMLNRIKQHPWYQPPDEKSKYGYYADRPIIGPYSKFRGGVSIGAAPREAIVIDDTRPLSPLPELYEKVKDSIKDSDSNFRMIDFFQSAFDEVRSRLKPDDAALEKIKHERGWENDQKVHLDNFFIVGLGTCVHDAAAIAYLTERGMEDGLLRPGKLTIDRVTTKRGSGHEWVSYEINGVEDRYIIDAAQGYVGWFYDLEQENRWLFARPGEPDFKGF